MPINNFENITTTGIDEDALITTTVGDQVHNFADVTTTGDLANGVYAGVADVSVDNFGLIETNGVGAEGVLIEGDGARVRNHGSIVTHGVPTDDLLHFNDAIAVYGNDFRIDNKGNLSTEGIFSSGVFGGGDFGVIRNYGSVSTSGDGAPGLQTFGNGNQVVNFGSISTSGDRSHALALFGNGNEVLNYGSLSTSTTSVFAHGILTFGNGNRLVNFGDIRVENDPLGFALGMDATGSEGEVVNFGTITGAGMGAGGLRILSGFGNTVTNWGTISSDNLDPGITGSGRSVLAQNFGTIDAVAGGIRAVADVGPQARNTGTIIAHGDLGHGLRVDAGADGEAVNAGSILTEGNGAAGVSFISAVGGKVTNSGSIEAFGGLFGAVETAGVDARGLEALVRNTPTGSIETHDPDSPAVMLNIRDVAASIFGHRPAVIAADTHSRLENEGLIKAVQTAVLGGPGDETVINSGQIIGDVKLSDGNDTYIAAKGGELLGAIFGGDGYDTFAFHNGSGSTRVADFEAGAATNDVLDVSAFGFGSFAEVLGAASQDGSDVVIELDHNDQVVLSGVSLGALHADDFLLGP